MNHVVILDHIKIENANAMAGFTYGFPAMTNFLGYVHALSRKLEPLHGIKLEGCAVVCHAHHLHANRENSWSDYRFNLTRNPLGKTGNAVPFIEEARMHLTLSLIIPCSGLIGGDVQHHDRVCEAIQTQALTQKIAGGRIMDIKGCYSQDFPESPHQTHSFLRKFLPGFMLVDGSSVLHAHYKHMCESNPESSLLDAWLDFCTLKAHSELSPSSKTDSTKDTNDVKWVFEKKGFVRQYVPIMIGHKRISELYPPDTVQDTRDSNIPFCLTEAVFSIGEWISPTRIEYLENAMWNYKVTDSYYVCSCNNDAVEEDEFLTLDDD